MFVSGQTYFLLKGSTFMQKINSKLYLKQNRMQKKNEKDRLDSEDIFKILKVV